MPARMFRFLATAALLAVLFAAPRPVRAAGVVTACTEAGLKAAIAAGSPVTFSCDGTITLTQTIAVSGNLVIDGSGHSVVISGGPGDGDDGVRLFNVPAGASLSLINLTLKNGYRSGTDVTGAAVRNYGSLSVRRVTFENNQAESETEVITRGGAVVNYPNANANLSECYFLKNLSSGRISEGAAVANLGTLVVDSCTFKDNSSGKPAASSNTGGAITNHGDLTVINSTFHNNWANTFGGAIYTDGKALVASSTFQDNRVSVGAGSTFTVSGNVLTLRNSIIDGSGQSIACHSQSPGAFANGGGNLVWTASGCDALFGAQVDLKLGTLGNHGGYAPTIPLLAGSPAVGHATANCPANDQRGYTRGALPCDSGAFELDGLPGPDHDLYFRIYLPVTISP